MKATLHFAFSASLLLAANGLSAQFVTVSQAPNYAEAVYYNLSTRTGTKVLHSDYDIAFNVGGRSSSIYVNEGVGGSRANPQNEVELYASGGSDFANADTTGMQRIYNDEASHAQGAFNVLADPENQADLGWGDYSFSTQTVLGSRVFFLKLRSGVWQKLFINSLAGGVYTFTYAALDGSGERSATIAKSDYAGKAFAYFSLDTDQALDLEPDAWDLLFTRYSTPLAAGPSTTIDYTVTGVLQAPGVTVAELEGVDPTTVSMPTDGYSDAVDVIGYDWKTFGGSGFTVPADRVYFVRTADSVYRVQFIDFEGGATGVSALSIISESGVSSVSAVPQTPATLSPNPALAGTELSLVLASDLPGGAAQLVVYDQLGRVALNSPMHLGPNQRRLSVATASLPAGAYVVTVVGKNVRVVERLIIR